MKTTLITIVATLLVVVLGMFGWTVSGVYDVGADRPHTAWMQTLLRTLRTRSIETRAAAISVPPLDDPARIAEGAEHYAAMCTECHLAPGMHETELHQGLLPRPPDLSRRKVDAAQAFWTIKHGVKATAMPAWGKTHDDEEIWNLVAFVQKLPQMTPARYRAATVAPESPENNHSAQPEPDVTHSHKHGHEHSHDEH